MSAPRMRDLAAVAVQLPLAATNVYLLGLLGAAAAAGRRGDGAAAGVRGPAVALVPAHDEEDGVAATVASLLEGDAPCEVVVIADNCADRTADVARAAGATVLERFDDQQQGKGHALAWALGWLVRERPATDMVVMVDADCVASPSLVGALAGALATGAGAAQARYEVANAGASPAAGLRSAAFALWNTVRPQGKERLGLSCGLLGTGMAFRRDVLERVPWEAFGVAEDAEYHARLVAAGERVAFVAAACVTSPMPAGMRDAEQQQLRWEGGRTAVARAWAPRLLAAGLRRRDRRALHAGLELAVPPQSLQAAAAAAGVAAAAVVRRRAATRLAVGNLAAQALYVTGGMAVARAPLAAYRALAFAPLLVLQKLMLYTRIVTVGGPTAWVRTTRPADAGEAP
jgi:hypothetical protein